MTQVAKITLKSPHAMLLVPKMITSCHVTGAQDYPQVTFKRNGVICHWEATTLLGVGILATQRILEI